MPDRPAHHLAVLIDLPTAALRPIRALGGQFQHAQPAAVADLVLTLYGPPQLSASLAQIARRFHQVRERFRMDSQACQLRGGFFHHDFSAPNVRT